MNPRSTFVAVLAVLATAALLAGCGDDTERSSTTTTNRSSTTTRPSDTSTTSSAPVATEQVTIWPAADVVFDTPEAVAKYFVTKVLEVPAVLGEFQQGDSRSGEIEVLSPGEGSSGGGYPRGRLLLRQVGSANGWFVLAAVNDNASITVPAALAKVPAGPLVVQGKARGFEANVVVRAFEAGDSSAELARAITMGGSTETPEPFTATLDLTRARPGSTVVLLVRGGTGLETDPGEFGAIAVVIEG